MMSEAVKNSSGVGYGHINVGVEGICSECNIYMKYWLWKVAAGGSQIYAGAFCIYEIIIIYVGTMWKKSRSKNERMGFVLFSTS